MNTEHLHSSCLWTKGSKRSPEPPCAKEEGRRLQSAESTLLSAVAVTQVREGRLQQRLLKRAQCERDEFLGPLRMRGVPGFCPSQSPQKEAQKLNSLVWQGVPAQSLGLVATCSQQGDDSLKTGNNKGTAEGLEVWKPQHRAGSTAGPPCPALQG